MVGRILLNRRYGDCRKVVYGEHCVLPCPDRGGRVSHNVLPENPTTDFCLPHDDDAGNG